MGCFRFTTLIILPSGMIAAVTRKNKSRRRAYEPGDVGRIRMVQVQLPQSNKNATNNAPTTITPKDDHHTWDNHSGNDNVGNDKLEGMP